jgi:PAS domain S-box-containing protein
MENNKKSLWELLWDYDPNGLLVVDSDMIVKIVNPSLCRMFKIDQESIIGKNVVDFIDDVEDFKNVLDTNDVILAKEKEYSRYDLSVKKVVFPIKDQNIVACIMVDITHESKQRNEMLKIKTETIDKVNHVVDKQMKVAQEIAGLLGETTAETKISLLKLMDMLKQEST